MTKIYQLAECATEKYESFQSNWRNVLPISLIDIWIDFWKKKSISGLWAYESIDNERLKQGFDLWNQLMRWNQHLTYSWKVYLKRGCHTQTDAMFYFPFITTSILLSDISGWHDFFYRSSFVVSTNRRLFSTMKLNITVFSNP